MDDLDTIGFGAARLPPGYAVLRTDDHTFWVRLTRDGQDYDRSGVIHWDRWASFRGAWHDYRQAENMSATGRANCTTAAS